MAWQSILATLVGLLGGAAMGQFIAARLAAERDQKRDAATLKFLALQLAFRFEAFAIECSKTISDNETQDEIRPDEGEHYGPMPSAPELPESVAYERMSPDLLGRIFAFPQERDMAVESHSSLWQVADDDEVADEVRRALLEFGSKALEIADALRGEYGLGERHIGYGGWDIRHHLQSKRAERLAKMKLIEERLAQIKAQQAPSDGTGH